jgi:hypothetical protein
MNHRALLLAGVVLCGLPGGCDWPGNPARTVPVPEPLTVMLPRTIAIQEYAGTRRFGQGGGIAGIDVRVQAKDQWGDVTKAFGRFRFEIYEYDAAARDHKGRRVALWNKDVQDPKENRLYWNKFVNTYDFPLVWTEAIGLGRKLILAAYFESDYGPRLQDERTFVAGE